MALVCLDIETSDLFDLKPGEDLEQYAPFHVAVAATLTDGVESKVWLSLDNLGVPLPNMRYETANELLEWLFEAHRAGHRIVAWNGFSFDLRWIGFAARNLKLAAGLALAMYDPMLQFFGVTGFPVGLDAVAEGMGLQTRKSLCSEDAPRLWNEGNHDAVIEYVRNDVQITHDIVTRIDAEGQITWRTKRGDIRSEYIGPLKTTQEVLLEPEPDQSWMDSPIPRRKFYDWIVEVADSC